MTFTGASAEKTYDGTALTAEDVSVSGLPSGFTGTATVSGSQTDAGSSENTVTSWQILDAGGADVSHQFTNVSTAAGTLTVKPAPVTITTGSGSKVYDGEALTNPEATITGLQNGETADIKAEGTITEAGSAENSYSITWGTASESNYTITTDLGTLEVTARDLKLTAASDEKPYDGTPLSNNGFTPEGLPAGHTVSAEVTGSQTDVGNSPNEISSYVVQDGGGKDVTASFAVSTENGTLTVTANTDDITIRPEYGEKTYDGTPLIITKAESEGLPAGFEIHATILLTDTETETESASKTDTGFGPSSISEFTITESSGKNVTSYFTSIKLEESEWAIYPVEDPVTVTITGASKTYTYNGGEQYVSGDAYTVDSIDNPLYKKADFAFDGNVDVVAQDAGEYPFGLIPADFWNTNENFANVVFNVTDGKLTIEKAPLTVTTGSASKYFDGTPLTCDEASLDGLVNGEEATVTATNSLIGESRQDCEAPNTYDIDWKTTNKDNYELTENLGKLTVYKKTLVLDMGGFTKAYDGWPGVPQQITCKFSDGTTVEGSSEFKYDGITPVGITAEFNFGVGHFTLELDCSTWISAGSYSAGLEDGYLTIAVVGENPYDFEFTNTTVTITE